LDEKFTKKLQRLILAVTYQTTWSRRTIFHICFRLRTKVTQFINFVPSPKILKFMNTESVLASISQMTVMDRYCDHACHVDYFQTLSEDGKETPVDVVFEKA